MPPKPKSQPKAAPTPGDRIRAARLRAGLTQVQLAARLAIDQPEVSSIESDRRAASLERLYIIAKAVGCRPSDLDERLTAS